MNKVKTRFSKPLQRGKTNSRKASSFNPDQLIRDFSGKSAQVYQPDWKYEELPLHPGLKANLIVKGYQSPTPIQEQSIRHLIDGCDLIGIAGTGTGKTAAFLIPIIQRMTKSANEQALVILPTRELALQVEKEFIWLSKGMGLRASCFIGGQSISRDKENLKRTNHLLIGTPGRLIDLKNQGFLRLEKVSTLVLDEFDRMLDMGFVEDINRIVNAMTNRTQTMFFSATLEKKQQHLIDRMLKDPIEVKVSSGTSASEQVLQEMVNVPVGYDKFEVLLQLLKSSGFDKVLIFAETKRLVDRLGKKLNQSGIPSGLIHGNKSQNHRIKSLKQFDEGDIKVLVATDVASRGLDVPGVTHVINYELPRTQDSYIHRIGRTGRAGKEGRAYTFV